MDDRYLVGVEYPATKAEVIAIAEERGAPQEALGALQASRREIFDRPDQVIRAARTTADSAAA